MKTEKQISRNIRVGMLVTVSLLVLAIAIFFIGSEQKIFAKKNEYEVRLDSVSGLAQGNPVKLSGVTVGVVRDILLPRDPKERNVVITLMVEKKFAERIRLDSRARLKKLGLLAGDSYIDITPGSPQFPAIEPGSLIPAQRATNVDQLIASGEDLVDNFVQISYSLKRVLERVDRGEGLLGELTSEPKTKERLTDTLMTTLSRTNDVLGRVQSGKGVVGRLVYDDEYGQQLTESLASSARSLQSIMGSVAGGFDDGTGALPALLTDPEGKQKVIALIENMRLTSERLAAFTEVMQKGEGLVPRLLNDKEYGDVALNEFTGLVRELNATAHRLNSGEGTAGKLIADPGVYESINDILIGINESKLLRWLVRSRQEKGIEQRYKTERRKETPASGEPGTTTGPAVEPGPPEVPMPGTEAAPPPGVEPAPPALEPHGPENAAAAVATESVTAEAADATVPPSETATAPREDAPPASEPVPSTSTAPPQL